MPCVPYFSHLKEDRLLVKTVEEKHKLYKLLLSFDSDLL